MQTPGYDPNDQVTAATRRCEAHFARTEQAVARLEARLGVAEHSEEQVPDALEELWALDLDAPLTPSSTDDRRPSA